MVTAYIGLGCNLGNCRENLRQAWTKLGQVRGVKLGRLSSPYRSEPVGMQSENWFINAVGSLQTSLPPEELLAEMLAIEASLGRKRSSRQQPADRTIDLDLLYWDDRVCDAPTMILPHPAMARRLFVLLPLAEIGPDFIHPVYRKTSVEMLKECKAKQEVTGVGPHAEKISWNAANNEVSG